MATKPPKKPIVPAKGIQSSKPLKPSGGIDEGLAGDEESLQLSPNFAGQMKSISKESALQSQTPEGEEKTPLSFTSGSSSITEPEPTPDNTTEIKPNTTKFGISDKVWGQMVGLDANRKRIPKFDVALRDTLNDMLKSPRGDSGQSIGGNFNTYMDDYKSEMSISESKLKKVTIKFGWDRSITLKAHSHKDEKGVPAIKLLMVNIKNMMKLRLDERIDELLGKTDGMTPDEITKKKESIKADLVKNEPSLFTVKITRCDSAIDLAIMLNQMNAADPKITPELSPSVQTLLNNALNNPTFHELKENDINNLKLFVSQTKAVEEKEEKEEKPEQKTPSTTPLKKK